MPKILAIDDKQDNLITISALLRNFIPDCTVITSDSGAEGIKKAKADQPDTILLDIKMPGMDGYEVCKKLKSDEKTKHIPVIMITAIKTDSESRVKGFKLGADAFLSKPIDETELAAQVKVMLRIKKAEDTLRKEKDLQEDTVRERTKTLRNKTHDLEERIKELNYLYSLSKLIEKSDISLEEIFQSAVDFIPPAWQFPEITCARLVVEDQTFATNTFRETEWIQACDIVVHDTGIGTLEVYYLKKRPESDEGPFLKEERNLINEIAERLGRSIEQKTGGENTAPI
jgi:CheY-like chemotaxis protein